MMSESRFVDQLPKVAFAAGQLAKIIDRHGVDITNLLIPQEVGISCTVHRHLLEARLVVLKRDWQVETENGLTNTTRIFRPGYDLTDGLEPNTLVERFPLDGHRLLEITFDAVWGTL